MIEAFKFVSLILSCGNPPHVVNEVPAPVNEVPTRVFFQYRRAFYESESEDRGLLNIVLKIVEKEVKINAKNTHKEISEKYEQGSFYEGECLIKLVEKVKENQEKN